MTSKVKRPTERPQPVARKLRGFSNLPIGWSFGEGVPVSGSAIAQAEKFVELAIDVELLADVFPNIDGGCAVTFYKGSSQVEVLIAPDGAHFALRFECGIGMQFEDVIPPKDNATMSDILQSLAQLRQDAEQYHPN